MADITFCSRRLTQQTDRLSKLRAIDATPAATEAAEKRTTASGSRGRLSRRQPDLFSCAKIAVGGKFIGIDPDCPRCLITARESDRALGRSGFRLRPTEGDLPRREKASRREVGARRSFTIGEAQRAPLGRLVLSWRNPPSCIESPPRSLGRCCRPLLCVAKIRAPRLT